MLKVCLYLIQPALLTGKAPTRAQRFACTRSHLSVRVLILVIIGHMYLTYQCTACGCDKAQTSRLGYLVLKTEAYLHGNKQT